MFGLCECVLLFTINLHLLWSLFYFSDPIEFLFSFNHSDIAFCYHCAYICLAEDRTCSLVISLMIFLIDNYFLITAAIIWSLMPLLNCSFNLQYISLFQHSVALNLSLTVLSSVDLSM